MNDSEVYLLSRWYCYADCVTHLPLYALTRYKRRVIGRFSNVPCGAEMPGLQKSPSQEVQSGERVSFERAARSSDVTERQYVEDRRHESIDLRQSAGDDAGF